MTDNSEKREAARQDAIKARAQLKHALLNAFREQIAENVGKGMKPDDAQAEALMMASGSQVLLVCREALRGNPHVDQHGLRAINQMVSYAQGLISESFFVSGE